MRMRLAFDVTLPLEARLLPRIRRVFFGFFEDLGVDREMADEVVLAMDEACANVIRHAFQGSSDAGESFRLTADLSDREAVVVVSDDGAGFEPSGLHQPSPEALSGRGLAIIRGLMTEVDMARGPGGRGTVLTMRKHFHPRVRPGLSPAALSD